MITTNTNGGAELIEEGRQGSVLREPNDPECVAAALISWLDPARREEGGRAAHELAQKHPIQGKLDQLEEILLGSVS